MDPEGLPPPGSKRAGTRSKLVEAAAELFAQRGFHGATLDEVARRAGMTTGAIYGNFKGKEDLFLAIFEKPALGVDARLRPGATFQEQMRIVGEAVIAFLPTAASRGLLFHELHIHAATHPQVRAEIELRTTERYSAIAERWRAVMDEADTGMPMEQFVVLIDAMIDGLLCQKGLTPSLVTDEVIVAAFMALANRPASPRT